MSFFFVNIHELFSGKLVKTFFFQEFSGEISFVVFWVIVLTNKPTKNISVNTYKKFNSWQIAL